MFPHVATCVDDLAIVRSMVAEHSEHTAANYFMHSGSGLQGRPSMGAWVTYGLGSECRDLPGFVVLDSGHDSARRRGHVSAAVSCPPATRDPSSGRAASRSPTSRRARATARCRQRKLDLLRQLDSRRGWSGIGAVDEMEATIANYELAFRMQSAVPDLVDLSGETEATQQTLRPDETDTEEFGRACLLARRMVERGVRFIELLPPKRQGADRWDQHGRLKEGHRRTRRQSDKPIAGLLKDLKSRGLLDETLVIWGGEFGRTPMAQGASDRPGATTIPSASRCGWPAAASRAARFTAPPTNSATTPSRTK